MQKFVSQIHSVAENFAKRYNLKVFDVTLRREKSGRVLRVSLDGLENIPVSLEDCAEVSKLLSSWLDENDGAIPFSYTLEVSSLGIDRPLKSAQDFASHKGKTVSVTSKVKDAGGRRRYKGVLAASDEEKITLQSAEERQDFIILIDNIQKACAEVDYSALLKGK